MTEPIDPGQPGRPGEPGEPLRTLDRPRPDQRDAEPRRRLRAAVVAAAVAAVVSAAVAVPLTLALTEPAAEPQPAPPQVPAPVEDRPASGVAEIAETLLPSVARVDVRGGAQQGSGSAVVYRDDGYLLTNAHVVDGGVEFTVTFPDGSNVPAEVVGADAILDLAVLRVDPAELPGGRLPAATFADELPRVGETAIAIGSPFELDGSVTAGIISGLGRSIPNTPLTDLIQTDAPINPGNSGGALVNDRGEVVGINTAILPASPTDRVNIGIGFAIPVTSALPVADQLIERGFVRHAQLGIQGQNLDPAVADAYGLEVSEGAVVVAVMPGSAADDAGLRPGDIIVAVDDTTIGSMPELAGMIRRHAPGDEVNLTVLRGGDERSLTVTLGAAEDAPG